MKIIKKEILEFNEKETDALRLVTEICSELMEKATDLDLIELAEETYNCVTTLWEWEE